MSEPLPTRRPLAIGLLLAVTAFAFDNLAIATAMPEITRRLGGLALYGAAFSAFGLAMLFSLAVSGPLADRFGPRPVLSAGLATFTAGLVLGGVAPTMGVVVAARAIQGLGGGTIGACAYVAVGRLWAPEARGRMLAILSGAWIVPSLVAPAIAGVVTDQLSWRLVFLGLVPFPIVAAVLALPALGQLGPIGEATAASDRRLRRRGWAALRLAGGTGVFLAGIQSESVVIGTGLVLVGGVGAGFALRPLLPPGTLRAEPVLPALVGVRFMLSWAFFGADAFVPFAVSEVRGADAVVAGFALSIAGLTWSGAAWMQASQRPPPHRLCPGFVHQGRHRDRGGRAGQRLDAAGRPCSGGVWPAWGWGSPSTARRSPLVWPRSDRRGSRPSLHLAESLGGALATGLAGTLVAVGERSGWRPGSTAIAVFVLALVGVVPGMLAAGRLGRVSASVAARSASTS
ncbi:MAG: MFS transporter [Acidimicrobiales bacterium]